ncbi:MAG: hypothetical protein ACHQQS_15175 [Thermoanaerobaculales bacterium]
MWPKSMDLSADRVVRVGMELADAVAEVGFKDEGWADDGIGWVKASPARWGTASELPLRWSVVGGVTS